MINGYEHSSHRYRGPVIETGRIVPRFEIEQGLESVGREFREFVSVVRGWYRDRWDELDENINRRHVSTSIFERVSSSFRLLFFFFLSLGDFLRCDSWHAMRSKKKERREKKKRKKREIRCCITFMSFIN